MNVKEFKERLFAKGRLAGFGDMEMYLARSKEFSVRVFKTQIDDYSVSNLLGVGFRGKFEGKMGYSYAEILDDESIDLLIRFAKENAQVIDSTDDIEIFGGEESYPKVDAFNSLLSSVSPEEKISFARALEEHALQVDKRVTAVNWAMIGDEEVEIYLANTKGLEQSFRRNDAFCYVAVVVKQDDQIKTGSKFCVGNNWAKFDPAELAQQAVKEGLALLGADNVSSGSYPVVLRNDVAANILKTFSGLFSAEAVQKGFSLLAGKRGESVAMSSLTLMDDPLLPNGGASAPFDAEGVASRSKEVISKGVLQTFLHNLKTAKKDGVSSTGNASKASFKSPVGIAPTNFFIKPGNESLDQLLKGMEKGLLIVDVQGLHSGANPVSGDFSLAASGYVVEDGKVGKAVDQITIAGNFLSVLEDVVAIGNDLQFGMPGHGGNVGSPSLWIRELAIAGK